MISNDWIWPAAIGRECSSAVQTSQVSPMHDADADQTHHQRTRHPRLGVAAAQPLGSIGHSEQLSLLRSDARRSVPLADAQLTLRSEQIL